MLIYDDAGYIAGIQISFFKKLVDEKYYPFSTADPYQVIWPLLEGKYYPFSTADPYQVIWPLLKG